jgi:NAD(P)-dependent dehydrogenase (short-subunit alcohol dehydrogenase family)
LRVGATDVMLGEMGTPPSVVITGASTGIGEACALGMARRGWQVFAGVRNEADAERLRGAGRAGTIRPLMIDVADAASIAAAAAQVGDELAGGRLAGLVNNAGIAVGGPLEVLPLEDLRRQLEVNTIGPVAVTRAFLPMLRASRGRVVMMGSVSGFLAAPFLGPYAASKFALEALSVSWRGELKPWGIHVAVVNPGSISTPLWDKGLAWGKDLMERATAEERDLYAWAVPKVQAAAEAAERRGVPPDRVARAVAHALTSRRPKDRYLVGADAWAQDAVVRVLPVRTVGRLVLRVMGLPGSAKPPRAVGPE